MVGGDLQRTVRGQCPTCAEDIPSSAVLIEYETTTRETRMFADCPGCREVVHPR